MEPKLVYRCLRQLSVWVTDNYYNDVVVECVENVPETGPVILAATHRNESIDVAVLAVTIPHGRQVSYWAKSSLFKQPVLRWVMESSGAIPVQRGAETASTLNTKSASNTASTSHTASQTQADLFHASTACLIRGGTLGVFPEGFSATLPGLGDLRSGAAWAAVEHDRAARLAALERGVAWESARIVPVSIVYTDAPAYQSKVLVRYGPAIKTADYYTASAGKDDLEARKNAVARMMDAIRDTLQADGINAPDWPTLHAAKVTLEMYYSDPVRILGTRSWILKMQGLIKYLSDENKWSKPVDEETKQAVKTILARYRALQIHTHARHADLQALVPPSHSLAIARPFPSKFLLTSLLTFLQASARTVLCLPPLVVYLPAYAASYAATTILTRRDQPESHAQVSAIAGGVGLGMGFWGAWSVTRRLYGPALGRFCRQALRGLATHASPAVSRYLSQFVGSRVGKLAMGYVALKTLMAWNNLFAEGNRRTFRRCMASANILLATMFSGYENTSPMYDAPPAIAENAHARRKAREGEERRRKEAMNVPTCTSAQEGGGAHRDVLQGQAAASAKDDQATGDAKSGAAPRTEARCPWKFTLVRRLVAARREAMNALDLLKRDEELWRVVR
ncbi:hypothetical protein K523DRAFT_419840 [Schizophyllum commune Tattone D]|nr:hypothetical protein K523DRAFT_419840 [Schizophyllum commune Tattone D]